MAACNWWGSADGPFPTGSGDEVSAGVDFVPWLGAPAPDGACIGGLPCTIDDDCSDGVACNGTETCNTNTNTCEVGTTPACNGPCETGVCQEPTGCEPVPDGPELCDSGLDICSETDSCVTGVCVNDGGGGDIDADGTCDLDDVALPVNITKVILNRNRKPAVPRGVHGDSQPSQRGSPRCRARGALRARAGGSAGTHFERGTDGLSRLVPRGYRPTGRL